MIGRLVGWMNAALSGFLVLGVRGYQLFLRTLGHDGMDVICYAAPPHAVRADFRRAPDKVA